MTEQALRGDVAVLNGGDGTRVRAVVRLKSTPALMLMIGRPIDPTILGYMQRTEQAVSEYQRLDENRSWLQIAFAWIFAIVALLVLLGGRTDRTDHGQPDRPSRGDADQCRGAGA